MFRFLIVSYLWVTFSLLLGLTSCASRQNVADQKVVSSPINMFPNIRIPDDYVGESDSLKEIFLAKNFWEDYLSPIRLSQIEQTDSSILGINEQIFADSFLEYIKLLQKIDNYSFADSCINSLLNRAESFCDAGDKRFYFALIGCSEKVLYNARSPYLDERMYLPFLRRALGSKYIPNDDKLPFSEQLRLASLNQIDSVASDFEYSTALSSHPQLYRMSQINSPYLLLFFTDPLCTTCQATTQALESDEVIAKMIEDKRLKILSMYIGEDLEKWNKTKGARGGWIFGYDSKKLFSTNELYSLRAIPSFYLLDREKKVLLKDASLARVQRFFNSILSQ